ncbi:MAG TPA: hypothetical protein VFQ65_30050, partial [Kofleriaceae bacterium]|nr:hypothetical protein [Kofleriaceae bacterium]
FASASDAVLQQLVAARLVHRLVMHRDAIVEVPEGLTNALCFVLAGQVSIGVFDPAVLAERGRVQRDATLGEADGTLMPPGPLARAAKQNLALFHAGELFNLDAIPTVAGDDRVLAFSISNADVLLIGGDAVGWIATHAPAVGTELGSALALTNARLRMITGIKHEILDFYVRNGMSISGPTCGSVSSICASTASSAKRRARSAMERSA